MIQYDDQQYLINKEASRIKSQYKKVINNPYLISSFNKQFDHCLKQLVTDYEFDFDKIALHLYYLFPVYEQKITSRTVAVRWWQLQMQQKINNNKEQLNLDVENNNEYQNIIKNNMQSICDQRFQLEACIKSSFRTKQQKSKRYQSKNRDNLLSLTQYKHALQKSLILQQQQQQRPILYKPKFIIDSQYKLQRYELFDSNYFDNLQQKHLSNNVYNSNSFDEDDEQQHQHQINNHQNNGNELVFSINHQNYHQNIGIQQILSKVVNNEFVYDQFGGFDVSVVNQYKQLKQQLQNKKRQQWWQKQLSIDSQDQFSQQQSQSLLQQNKIQQQQHQQQLSQQQHHQLPIVLNNNYIQQQQQQQQSLHSILCSNCNNQIYQIDDNWDQYQSD